MNVKLGLFYMPLSAFNLGVMGALIKIMSNYYSPPRKYLLSFFFHALVSNTTLLR